MSRIVLFGIIFGLSFIGQSAFAESDLSISISVDTVNMTLQPDEFGTANQIITASTTSSSGYTIKLKNNNNSTDLINTTDNTKVIPTFTMPSGSTSIPVSQLGDGYGFSTDNGANYSAIPDPNTTVKLFETSSSGANQHTLTFGVKVPINIAAGTYTNLFNIIIVANFEPCLAENICYYGNNDDGTGTMSDQPASSNTDTTLMASNYSRAGYGFAGWNTSADGTGTNYGPAQTITTGDLSQEGLSLYANWVQSAGNLQDWQGCDSMSIGDITALTDTRDGSTYAIAKYADNKCWMMENLRLDLSSQDLQITSSNTNKPTAAFITAINNHPASSNSFCEDTNSACIDQVKFNTNNINRGLTPAYNTADTKSSWYSYGVYYNWFAATAGNGTYALTNAGIIAEGDLCPAGWHLPTGYGIDGELAVLDKAYNGSGNNQESGNTGLNGSKRWRNFPLNYIYSGEWRAKSSLNRGVSGGYFSASNFTAIRSYNLWLRSTAINMNSNSNPKYRGQAIRCIATNNSSIIGNIHYDSNGGTGTMADQTNVDFTIATAGSNTFTKQNATFLYWNTKADGTGTIVLEGRSVSNAASTMGLVSGDTLTLYAIWQPVFSVTYNGNGADAGTMPTSQISIDASLTLLASNYSRAGYGFVGWSHDDDAATKLINGQTIEIFGPNQVVSTGSSFTSHADSNNLITLYAVWLPADINDTLQTFDNVKCNAMSTGDILALTDNRDSNTYAVAKLADGNCWMIENLRLDPSTTTFSSSNTNNPTATFISAAPLSSTSNTMCGGNAGNNSTCVDQVAFNSDNLNRSLSASATASSPAQWYSYGIMYNWYTASAGNGTYAMSSGHVAGDICPAGWRLPTAGTGGELAVLNSSVNGGATNNDSGLVSFPNNFIHSGDFNQTQSGGRGSYGRLWSATASNNDNAFRLGYTKNEVTPVKAYNKWDAFALRCIVKP
ncbi:InlB B-repeat-containing protein [Candidatus Saccharibacteria bacterium]|nr:InlB B-repeat-containing protein [Candidatus Saccharibacteria bacterium]